MRESIAGLSYQLVHRNVGSEDNESPCEVKYNIIEGSYRLREWDIYFQIKKIYFLFEFLGSFSTKPNI